MFYGAVVLFILVGLFISVIVSTAEVCEAFLELTLTLIHVKMLPVACCQSAFKIRFTKHVTCVWIKLSVLVQVLLILM